MRLPGILKPLLLGAMLTGCADLDLTNPNQPSSDTFWSTPESALAGVNATYNSLLHNGTYGRWLVFATDLRSDAGQVVSPWTDLSNFTKFSFTDFDFEVSREIWQHHYQGIFRANQVIERVPGITMDVALRDRYVAEAKFIRALLYFNLVNLYGNIPLITTPVVPTDRPATVQPAEVWTQIETDLGEAHTVLPASYSGNDVGRATKGAAAALLGKSLLQQRKWSQAADALNELMTAGYDLMPNYADNFTDQFENNIESVFEVQFGDRTLLASGVRGLNIARMVGPCGPSYCDGRPTRWLFDQFQASRTTTGEVDPRLDVSLYYSGGPPVYNIPFDTRYPVTGPGSEHHNTIFYKKYGEYYLGLVDQDWDAGINFRVIRFADVLLMRAEALNEQGQVGSAKTLVDRVRARVNLPPLSATLDQAGMRTAILNERLLEFVLEAQRWNDLKRHNLLTGALVANDPEFTFFTANKSELLPIPQTEIDLNPNIEQNPGW
jgi:hypothetical protein